MGSRHVIQEKCPPFAQQWPGILELLFPQPAFRADHHERRIAIQVAQRLTKPAQILSRLNRADEQDVALRPQSIDAQLPGEQFCRRCRRFIVDGWRNYLNRFGPNAVDIRDVAFGAFGNRQDKIGASQCLLDDAVEIAFVVQGRPRQLQGYQIVNRCDPLRPPDADRQRASSVPNIDAVAHAGSERCSHVTIKTAGQAEAVRQKVALLQ